MTTNINLSDSSKVPPTKLSETECASPKHHESVSPIIDTIKSAEGENPTVATVRTPPSCLSRYCTYVKHRIADFFDWVCSLFCSSKAVTSEGIKAAMDALDAQYEAVLGGKLNDSEFRLADFLEGRYKVIASDPSEEAVYRCCADYIKVVELFAKILGIIMRLDSYKDSLKDKQGLKSKVILTERQLRFDQRQITELLNDLAVHLDTDLPKKTTATMIEKVTAYSLGKCTINFCGKTRSLFDFVKAMGSEWSPPDEINDKAEKLSSEIREPILTKFRPQIEKIETEANYTQRYAKLTLDDLRDESQAVYVLADYMKVQELFQSLYSEQGDISKASLDKRIETLKQCLDPPLLGKETRTATPEMHNNVKESLKKDHAIVRDISRRIPGWGSYKFVERFNEVIENIQNPQEGS